MEGAQNSAWGWVDTKDEDDSVMFLEMEAGPGRTMYNNKEKLDIDGDV